MRHTKYFILLLLAFITLPAFATIELELTQGLSKATPIAVVPFAGDNAAAASLTQVITNDLHMSGQFSVDSTTGHASYQLPNPQIDQSYWQQRGIATALVGHVSSVNQSDYKVAIQLVQTVGDRTILLNKEYSAKPRDLRRLAHRISDQIYETLTHERGIFSTRIAYVSVQHPTTRKPKFALEVADADGYNARSLLTSTQPIMSPTWSPDGRSLAYVSFEHTKAEIFTIDVVTGARRLMTSFPGINGAPAWSPDGKYLALVLSQHGAPDLYLVTMATGRLQRLTNDNVINTEPSFAPDGKSIVFTSNRGGSPQIYRYDLTSKTVSRVTFDGRYNARASFTPDGSQVVLLHRDGAQYNIGIQDLRSGQLQTLSSTGRDESPSVAPNGKMVLYATHVGNNGILSVVSTDGKVRIRLPSPEGDVQEPSWSPFLT